jgi:ATP-dependent helicase/nuclease subunit A
MIQDQRQRDLAKEEPSVSFIVEASAGTGKTKTLVDRICNLVLRRGPDGPPLRLSNICAITFTEKAAGEMKLRLRQEFEDAACEDATRAAATQALYDLESAAISTFHSLAVSLLRERPIEAELDPRFRALDEIQSGFFFDNLWEEWIRDVLEGRKGPVEAALRGGFALDHLKSIASSLKLHVRLVSTLDIRPPVSAEEAQLALNRRLADAREATALALSTNDKLLLRLEEAIAWLQDPGAGDKPGNSNCGKKSSWSGGEPTLNRVKALVNDIRQFHDEFSQYGAQRLQYDVVRWLRDEFVPEWQRRKQAEGILDFDDQLETARRLLMRSRAARAEFQERFRTLLVDEFQDTDPTQLDIVLLLTCPDLNETGTERMRPAPGRLFIVGDPKQSIYRFRGADVETYLKVVAQADQLGLKRLELTTNFRSVPSVLRFVDSAFDGLMARPADGNYQSDYLKFGSGFRTAEPSAPSVHLVGDQAEDGALSGSGPGFVQLEAARLAKLILRMHGNLSWGVDDRGGGRRAPRFGDIAVLLPALTHVDRLEEELRASNIPYVLEGGKFYYARSEVTSALTLLRAVSNPNDQVAVYGALRSIFFGLSDEDLLRARVAGIPCDYRFRPPANSPLYRPFEILRELHDGSMRRPPSETFERLLHCTGAREVLAVRGFQSIANLNKLGRTFRSLQETMTFPEVVERLLAMHEEGTAEAESRVMEEAADAVRVLSIHKSKGLDFPIVVLAGLGAGRRPGAPGFLADPHGRGVFAVNSGPVEPPGWDALKEEDEKREQQECIRLLYVALTRARDHLVVSTHHKGKEDSGTERWIAAFEDTRMQPLSEFLCGTQWRDENLADFLDGAEIDAIPAAVARQHAGETSDWAGELRREMDELTKLCNETPSALPMQAAGGALGEARAAGFVPEEARERAIRLGVAYHEAMEAADFSRPERSGEWAGEASRRHQLDPEQTALVAELVQTTLAAPLVRRARTTQAAGHRLFRELPYVRRQSGAGAILEGKIDLLFEEAGGWVLVDYKTDKAAGGTLNLADHYRPQILEYLAAVRGLGLTVTAAYLLLARTGEAIEIAFEAGPEM